MENGTEDRKMLEELLEDKERRLQELERELRSVRKRSRSYKKECKKLRELGTKKRTKTTASQTPYDLMRPPARTTTCCICQISIFSRDADTQTFETDFCPDFDSANSALDWQPLIDGQTIVDIVKETAQAAITKSDYVFDEASQMYYSVTTGYYYEPKRKLFYEPHSRVYYSYDEETCEYAFHSQLVDDHLITRDGRWKSRRHRRRHKNTKVKKEKVSCKDDDLEEGEVREDLDSTAGSSNSGESDSASAYPPSLRMIVERSETLREGSLLLVTYKGATIGREDTCDLCIPDTSVSRVHAKISYDEESAEGGVYTLRDLGSQNGTFVNDCRTPCEEVRTIAHGDRVSFGGSSLLVHMHDGHNTCNGCEPGLLLDSSATVASAPTVLSKHQREEERKQQLRQMKKRYGLANSDYEADKQSNIEKHGYKDRADHRRRTDGSINPYEKDAEPASIDSPVPINNKGYKMLKRMGWDSGQGLGVDKLGILEPISVNTQFNRAGLGTRTNALE